MQEHIVVGPPGCGKTTWVARQVERAVEQYGADRVMVASLTRAAARVAAGRVDLPRGRVGTLHSICYQALGQPRVVDGRMIADWNEEFPGWKMSGEAANSRDDRAAIDDLSQSKERGDQLLQIVERARQTMARVPEVARKFHVAWEDFKRQYEAVDFTDMIERAYHEVDTAPGDPKFILDDEAQDASALELALLKRWGQKADHMALVGDPNQSIYHWRHSSEELSQREPTIVLGQSYRVPRRVQAAAVALSRRSSTHLEAAYKPREEEGKVSRLAFTYANAEHLLRYAKQLEGSVMVLATCGYMLNGLLAVLRSTGHPYHNPYRNETKWNPLMRGVPRRRTALDRLEAWLTISEYLQSPSDAEVMPAVWQVSLLAKSLMRTGATGDAEAVLRLLPEAPTREQVTNAIHRVFTEELRSHLLAGSHDAGLQHCKAAQRRSLIYPLAVLQRHGKQTLFSVPNLIVGTIHSVKGGEADHVILAPDLSIQGYRSFQQRGWAHRDGIFRTLYVGMTRSRVTLSVLAPQGLSVSIFK